MTAMTATTAADRTPPTTPTPRHPDDPLPLAEAIDRCYPFGGVYPVWTALTELQTSRDVAPWHLPLDAWWPDDQPDVPAPLPTRWAEYHARGVALQRRAA
jgi:hypothetical protein